MRIACTLLISCLLWCQVISVKKVYVEDLVKAFLRDEDKGNVEETELREFLQLPKRENLEEINSIITDTNVKKTKFIQTYKDIPVYDSLVVAADLKATSKDVDFKTGVVYKGIEEDVDSTKHEIKKSDAMKIAIEHHNHQDYEIMESSSELKIYPNYKDDKAYLSHIVQYLAMNKDNKLTRPVTIIDAKNGTVIKSWEGLTSHIREMTGHGGNVKSGRFFYQGSPHWHKLKLTEFNDTTCLAENWYVKVTDFNTKATVQVDCSNNRTTIDDNPVNGAYNVLTDALYFGEQTIAMYRLWVGVKPVPGVLEMEINLPVANGYWTGTKCQFGIGNANYYPLVEMNFIAHEVSHGFTQHNSDLEYHGESGGINEAFSDIAGEALEDYLFWNNDWDVFADAKKENDSAVRYMDDPPRDGHSIDNITDFHPAMDVHYSSGLYNKAFYNLARTAGWSTERAFMVFATANRIYWRPRTGFNEGACGVLLAINDYPMTPQELQQNIDDIIAAFATVGIRCPRVIP